MTAQIIPMRRRHPYPPAADADDIAALDSMIFDLACEIRSLNRKAGCASHPVVVELMKETAARLQYSLTHARWLRDVMEEGK